MSAEITKALLRRAVVLYPRTPYTSASAVRHARRQWIKSVGYLGEKWILARPVQRRVA